MGMHRKGVIEYLNKARSGGYWPEVRRSCRMAILEKRRLSLAASMETGTQMLTQCASRLLDLAHVQDLEKHADGSWQVKHLSF